MYVNNVCYLLTKRWDITEKQCDIACAQMGKLSPYISFIKIIVYWIISIVLAWNLQYQFWVMKRLKTDSKLTKDWYISKLKTNLQLNFSEIGRRSKKKRKDGKEICNITFSCIQQSKCNPLSILNIAWIRMHILVFHYAYWKLRV